MLKSIPGGKKKLLKFSFIGSVITLLLLPTTYSYAFKPNSIFFVTKSDNRNQVHYGVQTNPDCSLKPSSPAYPYWKLANGKLEGLLSIEVPIFGIANQTVSGNEVVLEINGFRGRGISKPIVIQAAKSEGQDCQISAFAEINGETNRLLQVHIDWTRFLFGGTVHSITFYGTNNKQEKIVCKANCSL
ncbi:hypothetical protein Xen7305DRAFT_00051960 [Xenococcus sp. PCC 7305]|uniref:DUF4833 domain-containing protein n=1 Tax=Xenococcus sp. PCC 7305 TaxID=102125 RepID=UPI0002AC6D2D|nr:DUF4833 domain-containing protein [Xenococcus sp. PCC 7305]ELS05452.1 hypothetical protein Xen7305DRAFT_00051960 [Xenococcus sp. PCC 7305]